MSDKKNNFQKPELSVEELSHALYHANLKLNAANQKLRQQEKQRLEFYANISHHCTVQLHRIYAGLP